MSIKHKRTKPRWLVPKQYPLDSKELATQLLNEGYILVNNEGFSVHLDANGKQIKSNPNRKRNYKFSHPHFWQILNENKDVTSFCNYNSLTFKMSRLLQKLAVKWF